jgi:O-antigen/teichoic acid export membrane protein
MFSSFRVQSLIRDSALSLIASFASRSVPFICGALLLRTGGQDLLAIQNQFYLYLTIATSLSLSGSTPVLLHYSSKYKFANDDANLIRIWSSVIIRVHLLLIPAISLIVYFASAASSDTTILGFALYFTVVFMLIIARLNSLRAYLSVLRVTLLWSLGVISLSVLLSLTIQSPLFAITSSYIICSVVCSLLCVISQPRELRTVNNFGWSTAENRSFFYYSVIQVLTVGSIFSSLEFCRTKLEIENFNLLIFYFQLYSLVIFIPGLFANVIVPRLVNKGSNSASTTLQLLLSYMIFGVILVLGLLQCLGFVTRIYGLNFSPLAYSHFAIIAAAIPSCAIAALNQISTANNALLPATVSSLVLALTFITAALIGVLAENFGYILLAALSFAASTQFLLQRISNLRI